ncbi:family 43 glycosylhydrolase [Paenibacillus sp. FSL R5-0912]|uniref:family 43 glycosylhydrolase n=1 Tax=Paenibacillus sp. FSL R5-0912 TaxID=1536771 RepID=UPI000693FFD7|nr:family 43 glycosylhydrolase [Paenibacillus sp. FSL R5-0912]
MNKVQGPMKLTVYTRLPNQDYTASLSNSVHLACADDSGEFQPLNRNYGLLFAMATVDEDDVIHEKGLKNPYVFPTSGGTFGIVAVRVDALGEEDDESRGQILLWTSPDLISFEYQGLVPLDRERYVQEAVCGFDSTSGQYEIRWQDNDGCWYVNRLADLRKPELISPPEPAEPIAVERSAQPLPGTRPGNEITVDYAIGHRVQRAWTPVHNTGIRVAEQVSVRSADELITVRATAVYSDGSTADKQVAWDTEGIDFTVPGTYTVHGKVVTHDLPFPLASGYADPVILPWNGRYYFLATNDNVGDIGIYVRVADTLLGLFAPGFQEAVILDLNEELNFIQTFWAPEFHLIGGELYILFAVGGKVWGPQCHLMKLNQGGDIMNAADWSTPVRVRRMDGTPLTENGITLDMTYFKADETSCVVWSYRKGIGTPLDTGSMLYIATVNEADPAVLTSEPVLLSRPLLGWENVQGTINNEGPYPLITDDTVYIAYSGGAATGYTYAVGWLSIPRGGDYLDAGAWSKAGTPALSYYSLEEIYGPGHNSFFQDVDGTVLVLYHGEEQLVKHGTRCSAMHRVHFNSEGRPLLDVANERDVHPDYADCVIQVTVQSI